MFNHPSIISFLVKQGADMEVVDADEKTPLLLAASRECFRSVRVLIELGADILVKVSDLVPGDPLRKTALPIAYFHLHPVTLDFVFFVFFFAKTV